MLYNTSLYSAQHVGGLFCLVPMPLLFLPFTPLFNIAQVKRTETFKRLGGNTLHPKMKSGVVRYRLLGPEMNTEFEHTLPPSELYSRRRRR